MISVGTIKKERLVKWFKEHPRRKKVRVKTNNKVYVISKKDIESYDGDVIILDVNVVD